ncbi:MAG: ATP-binding protein [Gammaproteobacteria bacterium]|jgi:light-regulated signal transduction histidine kinase (bacteriophytochrome)
MLSIQYYGWNWTTMVTCLSAAAFSAGAVTALSIDLVAVTAYLLVMFTPSLTATVYAGSHESLAVTFLFGTYLIFLLHIAKQLNRQYWEALRNNHLLDERARELESFAYSVSHDLRAPLRTIDGFSNMLYEDAGNRLTEEEVECLRRVREAAQRMGNLIDDLLELSRISRSKFRPKKINLSKLAESVTEKLRQQDPDRKVDIVVEPGVEVNADLSLLDVVLDNLLGNAWKFSSKKESPKIQFARTLIDGKTVYYVKDNGVGFNPRYKNKLFMPFQRLHHNEEFPGTGIGLATVKRIIEKHGGRVWANSKQNKGTTIYFTIGQPDKSLSSRNHARKSVVESQF